MINKIEITEGLYICFFEGDSFEFKPLTLLVGDQGCGKSTLLHLIEDIAQGKVKGEGWLKVDKEESSIEKVILLDMEKNSPRQGHAAMDGSDLQYRIQAAYSSHGEVLLPIIKHVSSFENTLLLLDEPETSLSLRSQYLMIEVFKKAVEENGCQLILATHNMEFIKAFPDNILSLEHRRYVTPEEFIELEKQPNTFKDKQEDRKIKMMNCRMGLECECTKERPIYDKNCVHYVDREGKSGYDRTKRGSGPEPSRKMKKGDFKNG